MFANISQPQRRHLVGETSFEDLQFILGCKDDECQVNNVAAALGNLATSRSSDAVDFGVV